MIDKALRRFRRVIGVETSSLILMYHRVDDPPADPWGLCIEPKRFAEQMEVLARMRLACRLSEIQRAGRRVAVTFDDGYADNLYQAKSVLERYDIPATVFVVSGCSGSERFWWDELEWIFLHTKYLPEQTLILEIEGQRHSWRVEPDDRELNEASRERFRSWVVWKDEPPTSRHAILRAVWEVFSGIDEGPRSHYLAEVRHWAEAVGHSDRVRPMNLTELRNISADGLIDLGAHTVTHRRLSALPAREQSREILGSRDSVAEILGRLPQAFSFPFGGRDDYTDGTAEVVRLAGFERACCTIGGTVDRRSNPFQLPRAHAENLDGDEFSEWLFRYLRN
jgi:peptidoglycan/xylan/chitin deacetylase (PgdA/CDA1 family)